MEETEIYSAAVACLENTLAEGNKTSNVDIQFMLGNLQKCQGLVQELVSQERDPLYSKALLYLNQGLVSQGNILEAKIRQLNDDKAQQVPKCPTDSRAEHHNEGDKQQASRRSAIDDTIIQKGGLTFIDIAGLGEAKQALTEAIVMPLHYPQLFTGCIKPWRRILLYGPPGTGKSRLAQAVSGEINSSFYSVSSSDLISSWVGESEKLIKELFQHATSQMGRSVIFIDEIDSICRQRSAREEEHTRRMKTELLKQMEGADNSDQADKIFLLCATNCPWELDSAFLRRFQKRIFIPLPDKEARIQLIKIHTKDNNLQLSEEDWNLLALKTEGYSGSDIATMTLGALFQPIRDLQAACFWKCLPDGKFTPCSQDCDGAVRTTMSELPSKKIIQREITLADFLKSLQTHRRTVTDTELQKFENFTQKFGEKG
ncbi:hypothetical protein CHS0354_021380 [Potamilus streckersoni]|uniref:AAA+ ATPase domain-containing protein n=1 Tax=Potamilus streckersoni TaxID=2493646 RepID=A0AAE0S1S8_9BIVA|nr:hypothetical protein CHS0354_021380 [Potamilus streckersoni]